MLTLAAANIATFICFTVLFATASSPLASTSVQNQSGPDINGRNSGGPNRVPDCGTDNVAGLQSSDGDPDGGPNDVAGMQNPSGGPDVQCCPHETIE